MSARGFLGAGDLYLSIAVAGVFGDLVGPFECKKLEIKPNITLKEMTSKGKTSYGQVVESVPIPEPSDLTVIMSEVVGSTMTLALLGTNEAITQTSGNVSNEAVALTATKYDKWIPLSKAQISGVNVTNTAGTTTYTEGLDYLINAEMGWIKVLSTGTITGTVTIHVDFAHAEMTGTLIRGSTAAQLRAKFVLDGINQVDGTPCIVTIHEAIMAADSAFDFLGDEFAEVNLPARMKTPSGYTEPYTVALRAAPV